MKKIKVLIVLLLLLGSGGCLSVKLNGFQEISERNPQGMEDATETEAGAALIRELGIYINELERKLESSR
jgi:hypothetical protein